MSRKIIGPQTIMDAKATTGVGTTIDVRDYKTVVLLLGSASSANLTVKIQGSAAASAPTFSSAQTVDNHWDYVAVNDYEDAALIDGDTGIALAGTDDFRTLLVNVEGINFINANITARSAGSLTLKLVAYDNN